MTQEIETRLTALAKQAQSRLGAGILTDRTRLIDTLQGEAPELRLQIKALAAALIGNMTDPASVAAQENVDLASAQTGVAVAAALKAQTPAAPAAPPQPNAARDDDWVGDSMAVGAAPPPPPAPPPPAPAPPPPPDGTASAAEPFYKNKWVLIAAAVAVGLYFFSQQQSPQPQQGPQGPQQGPTGPQGPSGPQVGPQGPQGPGGGGGAIPLLAQPGGQLPMVPMQFQQGSAFVSFAIPSQNGQLYGMVTVQSGQLSAGGMVGFTNNPRAGQMQTLSQPGMFQLGNNGQFVGRVLQPIWQYDQLGIQDICVVFEQQGGQDVQLNGSRLCIYSANCQQAVACGQVRQ